MKQIIWTSCIECARTAGYSQPELNVVAENERVVSMYERAGFVRYGRNPKGFCSRTAGFQEVISMRLELSGRQNIIYCDFFCAY